MATKNYNGAMRLAHRGVVQDGPENTVDAFRGAVKRGYEGIEIDLQISRDGEIIVAHDSNFTRMTLGHPVHTSNRRLADMTWEEISEIELPYANHLLTEALPPYSHIEPMAIMPGRLMGQEGGSDYETALKKDPRMTHLMRFQDFDSWLCSEGKDLTVEVEFKAPGMAEKVLETVSRSPKLNQYILFSGSSEYINEIQSVCGGGNKPKGLRLGANIRYLTDENKNRIKQMDLYEVGLNAEAFDETDIEWLKDRGIVTFSNLGDYPSWWQRLCSMDVAGFKTNYPVAFTEWWQESFMSEEIK